MAQLALAWTLRDPRVTSTLIGASSVAQLEQNVATLDRLDFSDDELAAIERILGRRRPPRRPRCARRTCLERSSRSCTTSAVARVMSASAGPPSSGTRRDQLALDLRHQDGPRRDPPLAQRCQLGELRCILRVGAPDRDASAGVRDWRPRAGRAECRESPTEQPGLASGSSRSSRGWAAISRSIRSCSTL